MQIGDFVKYGISNHTKLEYIEEKDTTYAELKDFYEILHVINMVILYGLVLKLLLNIL